MAITKRPKAPHGSTTGMTRRRFLATTGAAAGAAGMGWLAGRKPPAYAQTRELTALAMSLFAPPGDARFGELVQEFGKQAGCTARFDTIAVVQVPPKLAAEATQQAGHDIVNVWEAYGYLHRENLEPLDDVMEPINSKFKFFAGPKECFQIDGHWKAAPWYWLAFPQNVYERHWRDAKLEFPKTWAELHAAGKVLKKNGHPIGIQISHSTDANAFWQACLWCYGAKVFEADSKTVALNAPKTKEFLDFAVALYNDCMTSEVLSWDDAGNNRFILSGKGSWTINPPSIYLAAARDKLPIAKELNHLPCLGGPAGRHNTTYNHGLGLWKFSKNKELAKEFLKFFYAEGKFDSWVTAAGGFCMSPLEKFADNDVWKKDPKLAMLPGEGPFIHSSGWPGKPTQYVAAFDAQFVLPDMIAKVIAGDTPQKAIEWAEATTVKIVKETR